MAMMTGQIQCPVSGESPLEEHVNHLTHLAGLVLSIAGWMVLLFYAYQADSISHMVSCSVYGATLVSLYAASAYYHVCKRLDQKQLLRVVDHACIYLLIAGTYTPFSLGPLRDVGGWDLLWIEWTIALVGIVIKVLAINRFQMLSMIAYLAMGWLIIFSWPTLKDELPYTAIIWLVTGGIIYSLGVLFYLWEALPFNHAIWHGFVLAGSICHYFSILSMIQQGIIV